MPAMGPQDQQRHRHQRAGIAGGNGDVRLALLHGFERQPHAGALAPAHGLARLGIHGDLAIGVDHARAGREGRDGRANSGSILAASPYSSTEIPGCCSSASAAPGTVTAGPTSPPMASIAMICVSVMRSNRRPRHGPGARRGRADGRIPLSLETGKIACVLPPHNLILRNRS